MKKPNDLPLPDELFIVAPDDGKAIVAGELAGAVYFLHWEEATEHAVKVARDGPVIVYQCGRQLKVTA